MIETLGRSLPMAAGVAASPVPIVMVLALLMTDRAKANGSAFMAGWVACIISVSCLVVLSPGMQIARGAPTATGGYIKLALGCILLLLAVRQWRRRNLVTDNKIGKSSLMSRLDRVGIWQSLAVGFLILVLNMKNMPLTAAGAHVIATSLLDRTGQLVLLIPYVALASCSVVIPVIIYYLLQDRAKALFESWKIWLVRNNSRVLLVLMVVFGVALSYDGMNIVRAIG